MSKLIKRQLELYTYLLGNVNRYVSEMEIAINLYGYANYSKVELNKFHDSAERTMLTKDIRAINESFEVDKIILSTHKGIKIASKCEIRGYLRKEYASIFRKLNRARIKSKKAGLDKQKRFTETEEEFIEAFIGGEDNG